MVDLETVKKFSQFLALCGLRFMTQNLIWSGTKFLNSCSDNLQEKIEEASQGFLTMYKTGPVCYKLAMSMIMTVSPVSIRVIDHALQQLKISDCNSKKIVEFNSVFQSLYIMLHNNDKLFGDEMTTLINGYCTSSTDKFNARMCVIFKNHQSRVKTAMVSNQKWSGISSKKSEITFYFHSDCNYCGKHGQKEEDCWKKKQDNGEEIPSTCSGHWHGGGQFCGGHV
jgi:hypothetical protein